ncbi:MAG: lipopolysaccharide biosynthesis protein, partial [Caldilineaceae bacterium]
MTSASFTARVVQRLQNSRLLRNASLLMLANVIVTLLALVRTPALTWMLPKEDVGRINVIGAWAAFIILLSLPGLDAASYHYIAKGKAWALRVVLRARAPFTLFSSLGFLVGAAYWVWRGEGVLAAYFVFMALLSPFMFTLMPAGGTLAGQERFLALFWYRIAESLTDFAGFVPLLLGVWWISEGFTFYALNQIATTVMLVLVVRWVLRRMGAAGSATPAAAEARDLVVYGRHLSVLTAISVTQAQADSLLVGTFLPLTVAADFGIAIIVSGQMRVLWNIFLGVRYPVFVRMEAARRRHRMRWEGALATAGFAFASLLGWLAAALAITWLLPASYQAAIPYIPWLLASFVITVPGAMIETYFRTEQDERRQYFLRVSTLAPSVIIPLLMLQAWGVQGILWARVLVSIIFTLTAVAVARWVAPGGSGRQPPLPAAPAIPEANPGAIMAATGV